MLMWTIIILLIPSGALAVLFVAAALRHAGTITREEEETHDDL